MEMLQNYPNTYIPSTIIRYRVPLKSFKTLKLYNILGTRLDIQFKVDLDPYANLIITRSTSSYF